MFFAGKGKIPVFLKLSQYLIRHRAFHLGFTPIVLCGWGNPIPTEALFDASYLSNTLLGYVLDCNQVSADVTLAERMG